MNIKTESLNHYLTRPISDNLVDLLKADIEQNGYYGLSPLVVGQKDDEYFVLCGNHRLRAANEIGLGEMPCTVVDADEDDWLRLAIRDNEVNKTLKQDDLFDWLFRIGKEKERGLTQAQIGERVGWGRDKVQGYLEILEKIVASVLDFAMSHQTGRATGDVAFATFNFTEGLFRNILPLGPDHQHELVSDLINGDITKTKFKNLAEVYRARDEAAQYIWGKLKHIDENLLIDAINEADNGKYDDEWLPIKGKKTEKDTEPVRAKTDKLIQAQIDAYEEKNNIQLICGDFYQKVKDIPDNSIDMVLTDPPYNVANTNTHKYENRKDISKNFGEWDHHPDEEFKNNILTWLTEFDRITKDNATIVIFTSDSYISDIKRAAKIAGFRYNTWYWNKANPGTSPSKNDAIGAVEPIAYIRKGKPVYNFTDDNDMKNNPETPICSGRERLKDKKGDTLHPTQKPERIIRKFMELATNRGDKVFDGFMGVGTTARVAKKTGRKFIGIEKNKIFYKAIEI